MTTESNRQFVNFLFDKLLTTVDTDLIDTLDDDGVDNDHEWRQIQLEWESWSMTIDEEHQKFVEIFQRLLLEGCEEDEQDIEETAHRILNNPAHYPDYF